MNSFHDCPEFFAKACDGLELRSADSIRLFQVEHGLGRLLSNGDETRMMLDEGKTLVVRFDAQSLLWLVFTEYVMVEIIRYLRRPMLVSGRDSIGARQMLLNDVAYGMELM